MEYKMPWQVKVLHYQLLFYAADEFFIPDLSEVGSVARDSH